MKNLILTLAACFFLQGGLWQVCKEGRVWCANALTLSGGYVQIACFDKRQEAIDFIEAQ